MELFQLDICQDQVRQKIKKTKGEKKKEFMDFVNDPLQKKIHKDKLKQKHKERQSKKLENFTPQLRDQFFLDKKNLKQSLRKNAQMGLLQGFPIVIDLSYSQMMNEFEKKSLIEQIKLIYKGMRRMQFPASVTLANMTSQLKQLFDKHRIHQLPFHISQKQPTNCQHLKGNDFVYLSPDAEQQLQKVQAKGTAYIIGGLIDRSIIKYASLQRAECLGVRSCKLGISKYLGPRKCLNIDNVALMLSQYLNCNDWCNAFYNTTPKRNQKSKQKKQ